MAFKDILGQEKPIQRLKKYISTENFPGAYLFTGPEGIGKSLAALNFAKAVNCIEEDDDACESCASCLKINKNNHPDLHIIDAVNNTESSEIKIECIRNLQEQINLRPYEAKKKVFIIHDAHNLTPDASNAFLKTLEEPPKNSLIILISAKPALIFKTIISRCQAVKFYPQKREELKSLLKSNYQLEESKVHFLSYFCEGRIGQALRLKEENILEDKNKVINEFIYSGASVSTLTAKEQRALMRNNLNILITWFRDLYLLKSGFPSDELIHLDRKQDLIKFAGKYSFAELEERIKFISRAMLYLEQNVNVKLLVANLKQTLGN